MIVNAQHQEDFESLVDLLLSLHQRRLEDLDPQVALQLTTAHFLREFCTVRVDIGRQFGKTHYIQTRAQAGDIVILHNDLMRRLLREGRDCRDITVITGNMSLPIGRRYGTVWVDEWMAIKQKEDFYYWMAKVNPRRIVIFGNEP